MPTPFTGAAGEHYVLYRLLQREYVAGLAPQNAPNSDIIATNVKGTKAAAIQVKTRRPLGAGDDWVMKDKHEKLEGERMFYCFVDLKKDPTASPDIYIVPSKVVARVLKETHKIWMDQPGKGGRKHNDSTMRRFKPDYSTTLKLSEKQKKALGKGWMKQYKENWSVLGLD
jgi:hypothetical protein